MDARANGGQYLKRGFTEGSELKKAGGDRYEEDEEYEDSEKKKHRSGKSRKHDSTDGHEDWQDEAKGRTDVERNDSRRKSSGRSRVDDLFEDCYDGRKESCSRMLRDNINADEQVTCGSSKEKREKNERKLDGGYSKTALENEKRSKNDVGGKSCCRLPEEDRCRRLDGSNLCDEDTQNSSKRVTAKASSQEISWGESKTKSEYSAHQRDKTPDKSIRYESEDPRYPERKEGGREKGQGRSNKHDNEEERRNRRKWDESDVVRKPSFLNDDSHIVGDSRDVKVCDKPGSSRDRAADTRQEPVDISPRSHGRYGGSSHDKGAKAWDHASESRPARSSGREENKNASERSKARGRWDECEDDDDAMENKMKMLKRKLDSVGNVDSSRLGYKVHGEKPENFREHKDSTHGGQDEGESWDRSTKTDDERQLDKARTRDRRDTTWEDPDSRGRSSIVTKSVRAVKSTRKSRSPEGSRHHRLDSEEFDRGYSDDRAESDTERSISFRRKNKEREESRDDRSKGRGHGYDRDSEWESSKDLWKRKHQSRHARSMKDEDAESDYDKDWESSRHERERMDADKVTERSAYRRDRGRIENRKGPSSYASGNENLDSFSARQNSVDYERDESGSGLMVRRGEARFPPDFSAGMSDENWGYDRSRMQGNYTSGEDPHERYADDGFPLLDQSIGVNMGRIDSDLMNAGRGRELKSSLCGTMGQTNMLSPFGNNQGPGSYNRVLQQGGKAGRPGRGGRGRVPARDAQRLGIQGPMMGNPFGHLGLPPGPMQPMGPNISPAPGPPIGPGLYMPPFPAHIVWPGPRAVDMNMLPVPPGPSGPRFPPPVGTGPGHPLYFNPPGPMRGISPNIPGPAVGGSNAIPLGQGMGNDKPPLGWAPPRSSGPPGKAPSRGEQNDYSQNFVDTGMRPQNFIRELELTNVVEDYPKLRELIQKKDEIVQKSASAPMYFKGDLKEHVLSPEFFGTKFDVILVDPPWEEYVHRAPGLADHTEYWTFEEIQNLKIEAIADTPSFIFLWVGDGVGLEQGRLCLKKWGFRRCEDICWVKTNKSNATPGLRHDSHTLFQRSKEHCLMGIKGTVRRSTDGHIIHANIDTDIIICEEPPYGSTAKPEDLYRIIEHFALGRRRIELFGEDHNIRAGWLTVGKGLTSSNFNAEAYFKNFADKDGKAWQGGGGRNPPPDAPHLVATTPDIESLRPKSPPQKNQQQQGPLISSSSNKRAPGNSPGHQNQIVLNPIPSPLGGIGLNQEVSSVSVQGGIPWGSPMGLKGIETGNNVVADDKVVDNCGCNVSCVQVSGEHVEFESHRTLNML